MTVNRSAETMKQLFHSRPKTALVSVRCLYSASSRLIPSFAAGVKAVRASACGGRAPLCESKG